MKFVVVIPALGLLGALASPALAFETVTTEQFNNRLSTKLADPDDIIQDMSQRYTGNSATVFHSGNMTIGIVGQGGASFTPNDGPFIPDPSANTVPSKRQW